MAQFTHLHVHTQYSILDGANEIGKLVDKVKNLGMTALAITDHGAMYGVKKFHDTCMKYGVKPIIGCEMYVVENRLEKDKEERGGSHLVVLAKNHVGYKNLVRLASLAALEGTYYKPRIDNNLLFQHKEGLIISTACIGGEIPSCLIEGKKERAEQLIRKYKAEFGDDFYLELQRHETGNKKYDDDLLRQQNIANVALLEQSKKYGVKVICTNDAHFLNKEDAESHDILICMNTGKDYDDPNRMKYSGQEYIKSPDEMAKIFSDVPEALANTMEIADKVEIYQLNRDVILPEFTLPPEFTDQDDYLKHLTYKGAKKKYPTMTDAIEERLEYELSVVKKMGFAGYFLIVQDFIQAGRDMGVSVGPGRGSAAGSAVAYCVGITDVDPIRYKLLFERFLNPERVTMPDVDIDFDEDGRQRVLDWVIEKYGKDKVAQIITFGTMAAKSAIKDVARVLKLPLNEADRLSKMVPDGAKMTLKKAYDEVPELKRETKSDNPIIAKTLMFAGNLEGSIRQPGVHACGVIIGRDPLIEHIPLTSQKDAELSVTQFDGKYIEEVGMLKMDFLGLRTLSIILDTLENIKLSKGITLDIDTIDYDDKKTFELFQRGETVGVFQFESEGMQKYLKDLKPTCMEDLIAMNALYRPGPMDYIPSFVKRKHGTEKVVYPHPMLEEILKDTYGIMVYQEQIMQTAQRMAGYSLGGADILRRAMGKKKMDVMEKQKSIFVEGSVKNGVDATNAAQVFDVMTEFANYGFNRSHAAAYSVVAFQTAYLKAHFPAEYMAAVMSRNLSDIKEITMLMDECKRMKMKVLGPDVNESYPRFTVNKHGAIRFGLAAIKGVGENAVKSIIDERTVNGAYDTIFMFMERSNMHSLNKRVMEGLAQSGGFDCFKEAKRHHYFGLVKNNGTYIESLIKYANSIQSQQDASNTLFGGSSDYQAVQKPELPQSEEWSRLDMLSKEKELIGIYLSSHPLDDYRFVIQSMCNVSLSEFKDLKKLNGGKELKFAGIIASVEHKTTKTGNPWANFVLEDYSDSYKFALFSQDYLKFKSYLEVGYSLFIKGKAQLRYNSQDEYEVKISTMEMLADQKDKACKSIAIKMTVEQVTTEIIDEIAQIALENKGNASLQFLVWEPTSKIWVQMNSQSMKVDINDAFMQFFTRHAQIEYKIA